MVGYYVIPLGDATVSPATIAGSAAETPILGQNWGKQFELKWRFPSLESAIFLSGERFRRSDDARATSSPPFRSVAIV